MNDESQYVGAMLKHCLIGGETPAEAIYEINRDGTITAREQ